jgi:hypothetical protein
MPNILLLSKMDRLLTRYRRTDRPANACEIRLRHARRFLAPLAFGHVHDRANILNEGTGIIEDGPGHRVDKPHRSVW